MEVTNSVSILYNFAASKDVPQSKPPEAVEKPGERFGHREHSFHGQRSHTDHSAKMAKRLEKMSNALARLQFSFPALNDASSVLIERSREGTSSVTFSITQDESGGFTASFTFNVQYEAAGETGYTQANLTPASAAPTTDPVVATAAAPAPTTATAAAAALETVATPTTETAAAPLVFDDRVAQLIEYYRVDVAVTAPGAAAVAPAPEIAPAEETAPVAVEEQSGVVVTVDADRVGRVRTGGGDDFLGINADTARRINTGGGDDSIFISADEVARIKTGAGDDALGIVADEVRRVNTGAGDDALDIVADEIARVKTGAGDDIVNIVADEVRRINTGSGDDTLNINADTVARIKTGEGDDTLSIIADTITRLNTGEGDDTLNLTANTISRVDAGAGDDTINLDAEDAAIAFGSGGGDDTINITSVGALAIQISEGLATSSDELNIVFGDGSVTLEFASGERLTINNLENADAISVNIGGESIDLFISEPPIALDLSA